MRAGFFRALMAGIALLLAPALPARAQSEGWQRAAPAQAAAEAPPLLRTQSLESTPAQTAAQPMLFADGVRAQFDLSYQPGSSGLTLDLYQPASPAPAPLVVFVHGGGWDGGDSRHGAFADLPTALAGLAARGYVVASVNYRLSPGAHFPAPLQDVKAAIRWLRGRAADDHIDVTRVAVWGEGAGGQLAALTGVTCGMTVFEPTGVSDADQAPSDCVQAVIDWHGPVDLENLPPSAGPAVSRLLDCLPAACPAGTARLANPLSFVSVMSPPFLIQHGGADTAVPLAQSQALHDALRDKGVPARLVVYPDVGQDFTRGGTPDPATLQAAMAELQAFLAQTFTPLAVAAQAPPPARGPLY